MRENTIETAGETGLFIYDGGQGRYRANIIKGSELSGVVVGSGVTVELSENRIENSGEHGILVLDGGHALLANNTVSGNAGHGIALAWEAEVELDGNQLDGNRAPDLLDARQSNLLRRSESRASTSPADPSRSVP